MKGRQFIPDCPVEKLIPYDRNPRINDPAVEKVARSISAFGFNAPIIVDGKFRVCVGHTRLKAAISLGLKTVPVIVAPELKGNKFKGYNIADNATGELADWDDKILGELIQELKADGFDLLDFGMDDTALSELLLPAVVNEELDEIPARIEARCKRGELWELGEHRLLCGDATVSADVERVLDGHKADMVFTDPPYGVAVNMGDVRHRKARKRRLDGKTVSGDSLVGEEFASLIRGASANMYLALKNGGVIYLCHAEGLGTDTLFRGIFSEVGFKPAEVLIWVKDQFAFGLQDYHWRHEPILYGWKEGAAHYFIADRTQDTVWEYPRPRVSEEHPTMKPLALVERAVTNSSRVGEIVLDCFMGSGQTILACEKLNRKARGIEIDPHYCDTIIQRWENLTGKKATLLGRE